jgi:hypothetical protein
VSSISVSFRGSGILGDQSDDGLLFLTRQNVPIHIERDLHAGVSEETRDDVDRKRLL